MGVRVLSAVPSYGLWTTRSTQPLVIARICRQPGGSQNPVAAVAKAPAASRASIVAGVHIHLTALGDCESDFFFDVALYLLKRHSGIVWGPGRFAGLLRGGDVRRLGNPAGAPALGLTPWRTWGCPTNCKIPLSKV